MSARETVRWGIDLGTTNSALAIFHGNRPRVVKNGFQDPITPSAVYFQRDPEGRATATVGKRARQRLMSDQKRVATEFKRYMGDPTWRFSVPALDVEESAPELSARVLRELRSYAGLRGDLPAMRATIVTVPAAFNEAEKDDTAAAGELAELAWSSTLPEPVAAALAFGHRADTGHDPIWLAYDLGGGTFDAALVRGEDGVFTILDHEGDRNLGGKDLDEAIVRELVLPELSGEVRERAADKRTVEWRKLKHQAEEAKCQLSGQGGAVLLDADIEGVPDIWIRGADVQRLEARVFARTLAQCAQLLGRNGLEPRDVEKVLMVGGPTLSPSLRSLIERGYPEAGPAAANGLGIPIDCSVNPLTAVAQGAAVYAAAQRVPRGVLEDRSSAHESADVGVSIEVDAQVPDDSVLATGRLTESGTHLAIRPDWTVVFERVDAEGAVSWQSDPVPVSESATFVCNLSLSEGQNTFRVRVLDHEQQTVRIPPTTFDVLRGPGFGELRRTDGIGVADKDGKTLWLIRKGDPRKDAVSERFKTTTTVVRGQSGEAISIPIVQGNHERASLNQLLYDLRITSDSVPLTIEAGTVVEVTVTMGGERNRATAVFPDHPQVRVDGELRQHGQPLADTREALSRIKSNIRLFEDVRDESPEIDDVLKRIEAQDLVEEIEDLLDLGSEEMPDDWKKAGDRTLELLAIMEPFYERIDALQEWKAEHARCDENVARGRRIVGEVHGHDATWMAEWEALLAEYDAACADRDLDRVHDLAFGRLPAHFGTSHALKNRVNEVDAQAPVGDRTDRGAPLSGSVEDL